MKRLLLVFLALSLLLALAACGPKTESPTADEPEETQTTETAGTSAGTKDPVAPDHETVTSENDPAGTTEPAPPTAVNPFNPTPPTSSTTPPTSSTPPASSTTPPTSSTTPPATTTRNPNEGGLIPR